MAVTHRDGLMYAIKAAKERVSISYPPPDLKVCNNTQEICDLLGYENTLGMALFIRDWIGDFKTSVDECEERLLEITSEQ